MNPQLVLGLQALLPEMVLGLAICAVVLADMTAPFSKTKPVCGAAGVIGLVLALIGVGVSLTTLTYARQPFYFERMVVQDRLALVFKGLFLVGTLISLLFALRSTTLNKERFGEYVSLLLGAAFGACLLVSSNNFVLFMVGLETMSLCSYVLASYAKHERFSAEAGLKYTLYGAAASAIMLFGISYLYGTSGSLDIQWSMKHLTPAFLGDSQVLPTMLGTALVLAGLGFKIAMVPFHFWCPDTYQGAPTPVTAFLSVVSKAAGFAALARVFSPVLVAPEMTVILSEENALGALQIVFGILAVITMTYGNLVALRQTNAKRLLAYSAIAHAGYLLMAFAVFTGPAIEALLFYFVVYVFMNLGAFWIVIVLENACGNCEMSSYRGMAFRSPTLFVALFVCLIALTGIPPTAGFVAKLQLFGVVVKSGLNFMTGAGSLSGPAIFFFALALVGVLNSVVSLFYYMKFAKIMVFERDGQEQALNVAPFDRAFAVVLATPVLLFLNFGPVFQFVAAPFKPFLMALTHLSWFV